MAPLPPAVVEQIVEMLDVRMMRQIPVWEALGKAAPASEKDRELIWVCDGGTVACMLNPSELLQQTEQALLSSKESRRSLRAVAKAMRGVWKGAKKSLVARERRRLKVKDLDIGMMFTKKGLKLVYAIHDPKHPGPGHPHPSTTPGRTPGSTPRRTTGGRAKVTGRGTVA